MSQTNDDGTRTDTESAPEQIHIHLDFNTMIERANKGVLRASAFMGFAFNAAARADLKEFHPHDQYIRLTPELTDKQIEEWKKHFTQWAVFNGMRELAESFGLSLNNLYRAALISSSKFPNLDSLRRQIMSFAQQGELKRIEKLQGEFNLEIPLLEHAKTIVVLRNEIVHGGGVARKEIELKWKKLRLKVQAQDETEMIIQLPIQSEVLVEKGGGIFLEFEDATKIFKANEVIDLTIDEAHEICLTMHFAISHITRVIEKFALGKTGDI